MHACCSQNDGVEVLIGQLFDAGLDIAADIDHLQVGANVQQLRFAAQGAGADTGTLREISPGFHAGAQNDDIAAVFTLGDAAQGQSFREDGRYVFH